MSLYRYPEFIKDRFRGQEVHVVASGPSLLGFDYSRLKGKKVITINHAHKLVEHEFCIFNDKQFCLRQEPEVLKRTVCLSRYNPNLPELIAYQFAEQFTMNPVEGVWHRRSSGSVGICAALQGGASKVFIYGFDCRFLNFDEARNVALLNGGQVDVLRDIYGHSTTGKFDHPQDGENHETVFDDTIKFFADFPRNKIVNMSSCSAIPYFEFSKGPYPA